MIPYSYMASHIIHLWLTLTNQEMDPQNIGFLTPGIYTFLTIFSLGYESNNFNMTYTQLYI